MLTGADLDQTLGLLLLRELQPLMVFNCPGADRTVGPIIEELLEEYRGAPAAEVCADIFAFLENLRGRRVLPLRS